jgi:hypothetical protein
MHSGIFQIAEQHLVATHVVVVNRFLQQRRRSTQQNFLCLFGSADLVQTKTSMQISGAGLGCGAAKPAANGQGTRPLLFPHQMVQTQLEDFRAMLVFVIDRIQFPD